MQTTDVSPQRPRKKPVQSRSAVTVDAIFEATIQVLLSQGIVGLTTTKVAERAGVSVGTLYQYFPNKRSLMAAILERHLEHVTSAVERACDAHHGMPLELMLRALCLAFIDAKVDRTDVACALFQPGAQLGADQLIRSAAVRSRLALVRMLQTATDARPTDLEFASTMLVAATIGSVQAVMDAGASPALVQALREHLPKLCVAYVRQLSV